MMMEWMECRGRWIVKDGGLMLSEVGDPSILAAGRADTPCTRPVTHHIDQLSMNAGDPAFSCPLRETAANNGPARV